MSTEGITFIIIAYNSEKTISACINSVLNQNVQIEEIIVVDDGSTDSTSEISRNLNCTVLTNDSNEGRGYSRNLGVKSATTEMLVFCDSTNVMPDDFVKQALNYFSDKNTAAVFGNIKNSTHLKDPISRWRGRHLFREHMIPTKPSCVESRDLITYATVMKKSAILKVGNFNPDLYKCEDIELGQKLLNHGFKILSDPSLCIFSHRKENMISLCTRYNRWFSNHNEKSLNYFGSFWSTLKACYRIYFWKDLEQKDFSASAISLFFPFCFIVIKVLVPHQFQ